MLLSNARNNTERTARVYKELSQAAQNPDVKETLGARAFSSSLAALDRCFEMISERPLTTVGFKSELAEIQSPATSTSILCQGRTVR